MKTLISASIFLFGLMSILRGQTATPDAQQKAITAYPDLSVRGSTLNALFVRLYNARTESDRAFFDDPDWPIKLAKEAASQEADLQKAAKVSADKERIARITTQISQNSRLAFKPYSEHTDRGYSSSNVSKDFTRLMDENKELEGERSRLENELLKLTGEKHAHSDELDKARAAADAYIAALKRQGIVFDSQFRGLISYDPASPTTAEAIYTLDYTSAAGDRIAGPYTITVKRHGSAWRSIGGTPGDRRNNFTAPVIGNDGVYSRSPMEQALGAAMGR